MAELLEKGLIDEDEFSGSSRICSAASTNGVHGEMADSRCLPSPSFRPFGLLLARVAGSLRSRRQAA